jgi:hypothetical protein
MSYFKDPVTGQITRLDTRQEIQQPSYPISMGMQPGMPMSMQPGFAPYMGMQPGFAPGMPMSMQPNFASGMQHGFAPGFAHGMPMGMQPGFAHGMPMGMQPGFAPGAAADEFEDIQVPSIEQINHKLIYSKNLELNTKDNFEKHLSREDPKLSDILKEKEFQDLIIKGYDPSNIKYQYLELLDKSTKSFLNTEQRVLIVDYEHLTLPTYNRHSQIYPENLRNYVDTDYLPTFKAPIIYIIKKARELKIKKIIIICKNPISANFLRKHIDEFKTRAQTEIIDGNSHILNYDDIRDFLQKNNILIIEIQSLCNLLCQHQSSARPRGLSTSPPKFGIDPAQIEHIKDLADQCDQRILHKLKGCDDSIIIIVCNIIKTLNADIEIILFSKDRRIFIDFIDSQHMIIPFGITIWSNSKQISTQIFVNLARDPYDISKISSSVIKLLLENPNDIRSTYFKELPHEVQPSNWFTSKDASSWSNDNTKNMEVNKILGTTDVPDTHTKTLPYTQLFNRYDPVMFSKPNGSLGPHTSRDKNILKINGTNQEYVVLDQNGNWQSALDKNGNTYWDTDGSIAKITLRDGRTLEYTNVSSYYESPLNFNGKPFRDINGEILKLSNGLDYVYFDGMQWVSHLQMDGNPYLNLKGEIDTINIPHSQILFNKYLKYKQKYLLLKQKLGK